MIKRNLNKIIGVLLIFILVSCKPKTKDVNRIQYDFEVLTFKDDDKREVNRDKYNENILYIILGSTFTGKSVTVYRNDELFKELNNLETDESSGFTTSIEMSRNNLNNIAFRIDNGNLIFVEFSNKSTNFILFAFNKNKASIIQMNSTPRLQ